MNFILGIYLLSSVMVLSVQSKFHHQSDLVEEFHLLNLTHKKCPTCGQFKTLMNSVIYLETQIKQLTERLLDSELRLKRLESCDCIKSCHVSGKVHPDGSTWKRGCDICSCVHGHVTCRPIQCPPVLCRYPEFNDSDCCPTCKRTCYLNGKVIQHGEKLKILGNNGRCGECTCQDGKASCRQINACPKLNCPTEQQFIKEDECCPICSGIDFCAKGHNCHVNAKCHNLKTDYKCQCNDGYFGSGQNCEDINECLSVGSHYGHHCRNTTRCVNLPGSYVCDCLPGFTKSDAYNCVDIDECSSGTHTCHDHETCINTPGSYKCQCKPEFIGDGNDCQPTCDKPCVNAGRCIGNSLCHFIVVILNLKFFTNNILNIIFIKMCNIKF